MSSTRDTEAVIRAFNAVANQHEFVGHIDCECGHQIQLLEYAVAAWCPQCSQHWLVSWQEDIAATAPTPSAPPSSEKKRSAGARGRCTTKGKK